MNECIQQNQWTNSPIYVKMKKSTYEEDIMDYNNQNPYEQNSGTDPYGQNNSASPYAQSGTDPYGQNSGTSPYAQSGTQDPYGQSGAQTTSSQGAYSQGQGTQDSGQSSYYQSPYQQSSYQQSSYQQSPYQQSSYQQSSYQQPQYQSYQNYQTYQNSGELEEPMSLKEWLITDLLLMIPCANLILIFVWAFSSNEKKSKSNFFKAQLIFTGCILAFYLLLLIIGVGAGFASMFY